MKFTKIIISLISVCIFFSSCYVVRMPEESFEAETSKEETFTSEMLSSEDETPLNVYFIENNIVFSKPDVPKIDFERDFYTQVDNNFIYTNCDDFLNFAFVDEKGNCYIQLCNTLFSYDSEGKRTGSYDFYSGCYKINNTLYTYKQDSSQNPGIFSIYGVDLKDGIEKRLYYNTTEPVFCEDKLYFESDYLINDTRDFKGLVAFCLANGSLTPQQLDDNDIDYNCYFTPLNSSNEEENLTVIGDYLYTWQKEHNYIIQTNQNNSEKIYCKSPFLPETVTESGEQKQYNSVDGFNFTDSYFFFVNNDKIVRTDLDFGNRTELDLNLGDDPNYGININRNRIFVSVNRFSEDMFVVEIDANGNILNTFRK